MEQFGQYGHALLAVVIYAVLANVLNAVVGITKGGKNMAPGSSFDPPDFASPDWRLDRTYQNTLEMGVFYLALVLAAVLAGASPFWTNLLASVGLLCRLAMIFVYTRGIGAAYGGVRTGFAILASVANFGLGLLAAFAVFGG